MRSTNSEELSDWQRPPTAHAGGGTARRTAGAARELRTKSVESAGG